MQYIKQAYKPKSYDDNGVAQGGVGPILRCPFCGAECDFTIEFNGDVGQGNWLCPKCGAEYCGDAYTGEAEDRVMPSLGLSQQDWECAPANEVEQGFADAVVVERTFEKGRLRVREVSPSKNFGGPPLADFWVKIVGRMMK